MHKRRWGRQACLYVGLARTIYIHIYTVYIRYFWQGDRRIYGHIRCIYTVLADPIYTHRTDMLDRGHSVQ